MLDWVVALDGTDTVKEAAINPRRSQSYQDLKPDISVTCSNIMDESDMETQVSKYFLLIGCGLSTLIITHTSFKFFKFTVCQHMVAKKNARYSSARDSKGRACGRNTAGHSPTR